MPTRRALTSKLAPASRAVASLGSPGLRVQRPSLSRIPWPIRVIAAPPRSIRWVGPQRVTSWPKMRCQTSSRGKPASENPPQSEEQDAADRRVPVAAEADRRRPRAGPLGRQEDGQPARGEDAHQAEQDRVVGDVRERARVAAVVDVDGDVPVHADRGDDQRDRGDGDRQRGPPRQTGDPLGRGGRTGQGGALAGAVAHHGEGEEPEGAADQGGREDHLSDLGAAGGRCFGCCWDEVLWCEQV